MSIRVRLAMFGLLVVTLTLAAFVAVFYGLIAAGGPNNQDQQLSERLDQAASSLESAAPDEFEPHAATAPVDPDESTELFLILVREDGRPISSTGAVNGAFPELPPEELAAAASEGESVSTLELAPGVDVRVHIRPWSRPDLGLSGYVAAAQSTRRVENDLRGGLIFLFVASFFAFIVAGIAIWLVIGRALRPLRQLATLTDEVRLTEDLGARLPMPAAKDEVRRLSESFNGMMARLQESHSHLAESLEAQKRFVSDASHELRTPLTTIRSNAGFLLQHPDAREEDRLAALSDIASESERMSRLVHDLLTLARADGGFHLEKASLDLGPLVEDVARQAANVHGDRQIVADGEPAGIEGNEDSLKQLLWILVDNAVRHTSPDGRIRLAVTSADGNVELMVADDGEGIPAIDLPHIFDRFYQADTSRGGQEAGLGLSIASWIVEDHQGHISARNNDHGGATFLVELPAASSDMNSVDLASESASEGAGSDREATEGTASLPDASI